MVQGPRYKAVEQGHSQGRRLKEDSYKVKGKNGRVCVVWSPQQQRNVVNKAADRGTG